MEVIPYQSIILTIIAISTTVFALIVTLYRIIKSKLKTEILLELRKELKLN
jgi:multisubunit Na+/H+ antiporter MnhC subunit